MHILRNQNHFIHLKPTHFASDKVIFDSLSQIIAQPEMLNPGRSFWVELSRVVNSIVTLYAVGIIIYSLWFMKIWQEKTIGMPFPSSLTRPLFIHVCLVIGIALCLGTMCGYIVANYFSDCMLSTYIVAICCLLLLEIAVVVMIFIKMDWVAKVNKYIDEKHSDFRVFILFHISMCRIILLVSLVPQMSAIGLAINLRALGAHTRIGRGNHSVISDFHQSFLVLPNSRVNEDSIH